MASLFPGHTALQSPASAVYVSDAPKPPAARISLSAAVLGRAQVLVFARGPDKRAIVDAIERGEGNSPLLALPEVRLYTDGGTA